MMRKILVRVVDTFNPLDSRLLIALFLVVTFARPYLTGNEEYYLGLAKQFEEPTWMPHFSCFNQPVGSRVLYQFITGKLLSVLSFEALSFIGQVLGMILMAFPLASMAKTLSLNNLSILLGLLFFYYTNQSFFGHSNVISGFEPKLLSHVLVLFSLNYFLKRKWTYAFILGSIAIYFHVLAGGWIMVALGIAFWLDRDVAILTKIKATGLGLALTIPYLIALWYTTLRGVPSEIDGVNLSWIYVYFRNPHHLGIFLNRSYFMEHHLWGIMLIIISGLTCWLALEREKEQHTAVVLRIILSIIALNLLFVCIAAIDKSGVLIKFYPFRNQTFAILLLCLLMGKFLFQYIKPSGIPVIKVASFLFLATFLVFMINRKKNDYKNFRNPSFEALISFVKSNTPQEAIIALPPFLPERELSFYRRTQRPGAAVNKFVPPGGTEIWDWYNRVQDVEKAFDTHEFQFIKNKYGVRYVCSKKPLESSTPITLVYENDQYFLYKI